MPTMVVPKLPDLTVRSEYLDQIGSIDPSTGVVTWELTDDIFTALDFSFNPTTMSLQFVNQKSATEITTAYAPKVAMTGIQDANSPLVKKMLMAAYKMKTGIGLAFMYRRVFTMYPVEDAPDSYECLEFLGMLSINDNNPDTGINKFTGSLNYFSNFSFGAWDSVTNTFEPWVNGEAPVVPAP